MESRGVRPALQSGSQHLRRRSFRSFAPAAECASAKNRPPIEQNFWRPRQKTVGKRRDETGASLFRLQASLAAGHRLGRGARELSIHSSRSLRKQIGIVQINNFPCCAFLRFSDGKSNFHQNLRTGVYQYLDTSLTLEKNALSML